MIVTHFIRDKRPGNYSIEEIFRNVRRELNEENVHFNEFIPKKPFDLISLFKSRKYQGEVNHITGDINYYSFVLNPRKTILTVHDVGYFENMTIHPLKRKIFKKLWMELPFKKVRYISTVSEYTKNRILHHFKVDANKIIVIPNPIDDIFKYAVPTSNFKFNILQIGSGKHKNLLGLIEASKGLNCKLIIVGYPGEEELKRLREYEIDHKVLNDLSIEEVYSEYVKCDAVYFASFIEGFGMPIVEAQATGRPVITSNIGAMKEIAGDAAYFVDPFSKENIRRAIEDLMTSKEKYNDLIKKGLHNRTRFLNDTIAFQYLKLYSKVISENNL